MDPARSTASSLEVAYGVPVCSHGLAPHGGVASCTLVDGIQAVGLAGPLPSRQTQRYVIPMVVAPCREEVPEVRSRDSGRVRTARVRTACTFEDVDFDGVVGVGVVRPTDETYSCGNRV